MKQKCEDVKSEYVRLDDVSFLVLRCLLRLYAIKAPQTPMIDVFLPVEGEFAGPATATHVGKTFYLARKGRLSKEMLALIRGIVRLDAFTMPYTLAIASFQ